MKSLKLPVSSYRNLEKLKVYVELSRSDRYTYTGPVEWLILVTRTCCQISVAAPEDVHPPRKSMAARNKTVWIKPAAYSSQLWLKMVKASSSTSTTLRPMSASFSWPSAFLAPRQASAAAPNKETFCRQPKVVDLIPTVAKASLARGTCQASTPFGQQQILSVRVTLPQAIALRNTVCLQ